MLDVFYIHSREYNLSAPPQSPFDQIQQLYKIKKQLTKQISNKFNNICTNWNIWYLFTRPFFVKILGYLTMNEL